MTAPRQRSRPGRPSKAAVLELATSFANDRNRIDVATNPIANGRQLRQGLTPIKLNGTQLGGEQLGGESIRLDSPPPSLALETLIGIRSQMNSAISRCHDIKV